MLITPPTSSRRALASLLCSWLDGYPQDFVQLDPRLWEQVENWLHWAQGHGSGPKKSLPEVSRGREPREERAASDGDPDPHYILGLQAEDVAAHLTAQDAVSRGAGWEWAASCSMAEGPLFRLGPAPFASEP